MKLSFVYIHADFQRVSVITAWFCAILTSRESHSATSEKYVLFVVRFPENIVVFIHQKRRADNTQNYTQINGLFVVLKKVNVLFCHK